MLPGDAYQFALSLLYKPICAIMEPDDSDSGSRSGCGQDSTWSRFRCLYAISLALGCNIVISSSLAGASP